MAKAQRHSEGKEGKRALAKDFIDIQSINGPGRLTRTERIRPRDREETPSELTREHAEGVNGSALNVRLVHKSSGFASDHGSTDEKKTNAEGKIVSRGRRTRTRPLTRQ